MLGQEIFVAILVVGAVAYLGWHFWRRHRRKAGCASCKLMQAAQHPAENARPTANKPH